MTELSHEELSVAVRAGARGLLAEEAAVELLVAHGSWLHRADFVERCIRVTTAGTRADSEATSDRHLAFVDWQAAVLADLPASSSELRVLCLAAELAGVDSGRPLIDLVTGLDQRNATLVLRSLMHVNDGTRGHPLVVVPFDPRLVAPPRVGRRPPVWRPSSEPSDPSIGP